MVVRERATPIIRRNKMKYFLEIKDHPKTKVEVTKQEWIRAERRAGFMPDLDHLDPKYDSTCATGGFSSGLINGSIEEVSEGEFR